MRRDFLMVIQKAAKFGIIGALLMAFIVFSHAKWGGILSGFDIPMRLMITVAAYGYLAAFFIAAIFIYSDYYSPGIKHWAALPFAFFHNAIHDDLTSFYNQQDQIAGPAVFLESTDAIQTVPWWLGDISFWLIQILCGVVFLAFVYRNKTL